MIDRADRQVKVLEGPTSLFIKFREFYENVGVDPGGAEACDFTISKTGSGLDTEYKVSFKLANRKAFTADEKALLSATKMDLDELYRPTDPAEIEAALGLSRL